MASATTSGATRMRPRLRASNARPDVWRRRTGWPARPGRRILVPVGGTRCTTSDSGIRDPAVPSRSMARSAVRVSAASSRAGSGRRPSASAISSTVLSAWRASSSARSGSSSPIRSTRVRPRSRQPSISTSTASTPLTASAHPALRSFRIPRMARRASRSAAHRSRRAALSSARRSHRSATPRSRESQPAGAVAEPTRSPDPPPTKVPATATVARSASSGRPRSSPPRRPDATATRSARPRSARCSLSPASRAAAAAPPASSPGAVGARRAGSHADHARSRSASQSARRRWPPRNARA